MLLSLSLIELAGNSRLSAGSSLLVHNALSGSLIDFLYSKSCGLFNIAVALDSSVDLLEVGLEVVLDGLVAKVPLLSGTTLKCGAFLPNSASSSRRSVAE